VKLGPSFFTSAGARLMVVRPKVNEKSELINAVNTRSRDSFTAESGGPTITMMVSPYSARFLARGRRKRGRSRPRPWLQGCIKPARSAAFMRQRHGNCENLPAKAGVPAQHRLGWRA